MVASPYWINQTLAIVPRPRGDDWLDEEMAALHEAGVDVLVSFLEAGEARELGLEREQNAAGRAGLEFVHFPIRDRCVPERMAEFEALLSLLETRIAAGKRVGVHCRGCIGRSSVIAASLLIRAGESAEAAWRRIEQARDAPVPDTLVQFEWVNANMRPRQ